MNHKQVELLAPAGSFDAMRAAVNAGADAVYIGGTSFGARAYADNLSTETLKQAIDYVHLHGRSLYLTVNTLLKNEELYTELYAYLKPFYEHGLDAVIVQDTGVLSFIRKTFPDLPVHASTQMTITSSYGARFLKEQGVSRIVTARELSLKEIAHIKKEANIEIESFVHGALCYCYSGQCLLSSFIGGRSGNRGRCAQPCRLPYQALRGQKPVNSSKEAYLLSPRDMCTIELIPDIIEAGVYSFKIEGRMKQPSYAAGVTRLYRKYIDLYMEKGRDGFAVTDEDKQELFDIFNRCGFNEGYYKTYNGRSMITLTEPAKRMRNEALHKELTAYIDQEPKECIRGTAILKKGEPAVLELSSGGCKVKAGGTVVEEASRQPMDRARVEKQLLKTGGTPFVFEQLDIELDDGVFIPIQGLNEMRREALDKLASGILSPFHRSSGKTPPIREHTACEPGTRHNIHVYIEKECYLPGMLSADGIEAVYLDAGMLNKPVEEYTVCCHEAGKQCLLMLPHIFREHPKGGGEFLKGLLHDSLDGAVVRSYGEFQLLKEIGFTKEIIIDYTVYTFNEESLHFWSRQGTAIYDTAPVELNYRELKERGLKNSSLIVYGYLPVMVSAQCVHKTLEGCDKKTAELVLKDRIGKRFTVKNNCRFCYNTVYNCQPLSLFDHAEEIDGLAPRNLRLHFTMETPEKAMEIVQAYTDRFINKKAGGNPAADFTKGHFKRGIE